jgi:hypothetical protein
MTTAMDDIQQLGRVRRGSLLETAQFLTTFKSHFCLDTLTAAAAAAAAAKQGQIGTNSGGGGAPAGRSPTSPSTLGVISPRDIENALEYRQLVYSRQEQEQQYYVAEQDIPNTNGNNNNNNNNNNRNNNSRGRVLGRRQVERIKDAIDDIQVQIDKCTEREKAIHHLLRRFEVWSTKAIAQSVLLTPRSTANSSSELANNNNPCCYSPLLNLPSAKHFQNLLPDSLEEDPPMDFTTGESESAFHNLKPSCCSLSLPPNSHTWEAYAKIIQMVSILDTDAKQKALESNCCVQEISHSSHKRNPSFNQQFQFAGPDLVALWVRAQRNTQAMRQLWLLFEVASQNKSNKDEEECWTIQGTGRTGTGKQLVSGLAGGAGGGTHAAEHAPPAGAHAQHRGGGGAKPLSVRAIFNGNPNHAKLRILDNSPLVDQLVEWAVTNQVLFTYRYIREGIQKIPQQRLKRRLQLGRLFQPSAKRARRQSSSSAHDPSSSSSPSDSDLIKLQQACRIFVLRWFARRNRRALTVLFSSNLTNLHHDIGCTKADRIMAKLLMSDEAIENNVVEKNAIEKNAIEKIRLYLEREDISDIKAWRGDRTFARIDRRLLIADRYDREITLSTQVQTLLQALGESAPSRQLDPPLVKAAKADFKEMYNMFLGGDRNNIHETVLDLLDVTGDSELTENPAELLLSTPLPWPDKCVGCDQGGDAENGALRYCANCEAVFHAKCSNPKGAKMKLEAAIGAYQPLSDLCRLKKPDDVQPPDFRRNGNREGPHIQWTSKCITIERDVRKDGTLVPLGLMLRHTEECKETFECLYPASSLVFELVDVIRSDNKAKRKSFPLAVDKVGCLITDAFGDDKGVFCGKKCGLAAGDVIMALEIVSFMNKEEKDKSLYPEKKVFTFSKQPVSVRIDLLKQKCTVLKVIILRPSENIIRTSSEWYTRIKRLNKSLTNVFVDSMAERESGTTLWFCGKCLVDPSNVQNNEIKASTLREAEFCRSVIRRLGMESYSLPFFDERPDDPSVKKDLLEAMDHTQFVSFRRLDSMMTYIMTQQSKENAAAPDPEALRKSFFLPPWALDSPSSPQRLQWAPEELEEKPMELLCRAMSLLLGAGRDDSKREERKHLSRHFFTVFSAWCVGALVSIEGPLTKGPLTTGPSKIAQCARVPWLRDSCSVCFSRPCTNRSDGDRLCDSSDCFNAVHSKPVEEEEPKDAEVLQIAKSNASYVNCASLVGTTLLVLPNDPLIHSVSRIVNIDHDERPVEFIVASYIPPEVVEELSIGCRDDDLDRFEGGDGVYHLLPVVSTRQLTFILERCRTRQPPRKTDTGHSHFSWTSLDVLSLDGVPRFSPKELEKKLIESCAIREAIDEEVAEMGRRSNTGDAINPQMVTRPEANGLSSIRMPLHRFSHWHGEDPMSHYSHFIDSLIYRSEPLVRDMVDMDLLADLVPDDPLGPGNGAVEVTRLTPTILQLPPASENRLEPPVLPCPHQAIEERFSVAETENTAVSSDDDADAIEVLYVRQALPTRSPTTAGTQPRMEQATTSVAERPSEGPIVRHESNIQPEWKTVYNFIAGTHRTRRHITQQDLYCPGIKGTVLTLAEMAVFCECVRQKQPILGMRLLCPRYDLDVVMAQAEILKRTSGQILSTVPAIPERIHWMILRFDYKRAVSTTYPETGDAVFFEGMHQYRSPVDRLPIDRCIERALQDDVRRNLGQQQMALQQPYSTLSPPEGRPMGYPQQPGPQYPPNAHYAATQWQNQSPVEHAATPPYNNSRGPPDQSAADRIRGGGPLPGERLPEDGPSTEPYEDTCLADIDVNTWLDRAVFSMVQTSADGDVNEKATLIGFVKSFETVEGDEIPEAVKIEAHYLSNVGYFDEPRSYDFDPENLWIVETDSGSSKSNIVKKIISMRRHSPFPGSTLPAETEQQDSSRHTTAQSSSQRSAFIKMAMGYIRRIGHMSVLGELPDGREVLWIQSDPRALYIRAADDCFREAGHSQFSLAAQLQYISVLDKQAKSGSGASFPILRECDPASYCCLWGCSLLSGNEVLSFRTREEVNAHYVKCHSFAPNADITSFGETGQFARIPEGDILCDFGAALTTSICARWPSLIEDADKKASPSFETTPDGLVFRRSPTGSQLSFNLSGRFKKVITGILQQQNPADPTVYLHCRLWSRIARLFAVDEGGLFRLTPTEFQEHFIKASGANKPNVASEHPGKECFSCERVTTSHSAPSKGSMNCSLCTLSCEKVVRWRQGHDMSSDETPICRSLGCALWGDVSAPERPVSSEESIPGNLGQAKSLLLRVASYVPEPLRLLGDVVGLDPLAGCRIWNDQNFEIWKSFVREGANIRMLAQAFVAMLASIHKERLPRWWRHEGGGWSTPQAFLVDPTRPAFFLHLYVFDAAVAEFTSTIYLQESNISGKRRPNSGSLSRRMKAFLKMSDKLGFNRFAGAHQDTCCFCDEGGSLLCCELCDNVQHVLCCDPPVENTDELESWICDRCINDINLKTSQQEQEEMSAKNS